MITNHDNTATGQVASGVLQDAELFGWETALYNLNREQLAKCGIIQEDQRCADWRYLLPLNSKSDLLLLGSGWGAIPVALSEVCRSVYAVDSSWEKTKFLDIRRIQQGKDNLFPINGRCDSELPFPDGSFNAVAVNELQGKWRRSQTFPKAIRAFYRLLKEDGILYLSLRNRLSFQGLLRGNDKPASSIRYSIFGYKAILREEGFSKIQFYAPLPRQDGIPLFYIPLMGDLPMKFFFRNIFPLFEAVSPEVKKAYGFQYAVAKLAVRLNLHLGLTSLAKVFVPGFMIIAEKK